MEIIFKIFKNKIYVFYTSIRSRYPFRRNGKVLRGIIQIDNDTNTRSIRETIHRSRSKTESQD